MTELTRLSCQETFRRLEDYIDRELDSREMKLVQEHLEQCLVCAKEFDFEGTLIAELREKISRIEVAPNLIAKISHRLKEASRDEE